MPISYTAEQKRINGARVPVKLCRSCNGEMKNMHVLRQFCSGKCQRDYKKTQ